MFTACIYSIGVRDYEQRRVKYTKKLYDPV